MRSCASSPLTSPVPAVFFFFPPCSATTHTDLVLRAFEAGIKVHVIHNASIMNAAGACGLQLYNFGQTISIPFFTSEWRPDSFYNRIAYNAKGGMHTLCLLGETRGGKRGRRSVVSVTGAAATT